MQDVAVSDADREKWEARYRQGAYGDRPHPSPLLQEWVDRIPRGPALDVACGAGRNALFLAARGFDVDAVDISSAALEQGRERAAQSGLHVNWIEHDLDEPLNTDQRYALIIVMRFVDLPLIRRLADRLAPGGFLICEEHLRTDADVEVGGPSNPLYRVDPGSLRAAAGPLQILFYDEGLLQDPDGRAMALARLVAQRPTAQL